MPGAVPSRLCTTAMQILRETRATLACCSSSPESQSASSPLPSTRRTTLARSTWQWHRYLRFSLPHPLSSSMKCTTLQSPAVPVLSRIVGLARYRKKRGMRLGFFPLKTCLWHCGGVFVCVCCMKGKRIGHDGFVCLCAWKRRGSPKRDRGQKLGLWGSRNGGSSRDATIDALKLL